MGNLLSSLTNVPATLRLLGNALRALRTMQAEFSELRKRANTGPGLPVVPEESFWLRDPPFPHLVAARSEQLAEEADVVVVGSGITAAAAVWSILGGTAGRSSGAAESSPPPRVVVLEANTLCSGATARNGGHIKAAPQEAFTGTKRVLGGDAARAAAVARFQLRHLDCLVDLCRDQGWDAAECREVTTADLYLDQESFDTAKEYIDEANAWVPEFDVKILDADEARRRLNTSRHVVGATTYRAGALWSYRLVTSAWATLLASHGPRLSVETETPVTGITTTADAAGRPSHPYVVATPRGNVRARHVLHATNAWAANLVPGLRGCLSGARAHVTAQRVDGVDEAGMPVGYVGAAKAGDRSWSVIYKGGFDYVSQRPANAGGGGGDGSRGEGAHGVRGGELILGGGFVRSAGKGMDMFFRHDASVLDPLTLAHVHGMPSVVFPSDSPWARTTAIHEWGGIFAVTGDLLPFVGRLGSGLTGRWDGGEKAKGGGGEESIPAARAPAGEWISAGYNGEGMVMAWLCGIAVGAMIMGENDKDVPEYAGRPGGRVDGWLPEDMRSSLSRARGRADLCRLAAMFRDE